MLTNERPYEANPQVAEIARLEALLKSRNDTIWSKDQEITRLQERLHETERKNELALSQTWEIRILKRVLRVIVVLLWFILALSCLAGPPYLHLFRHAPAEMYILFIPGLILGGLFWAYIHTREQ